MFQKIKRIAGTVAIVIFVIALIYVLIVRISGNTPTLFGYSILRVQSDSMEPELDIGDIILVRDTDPQELKKDDVISYNGTEYPVSGMLITHQIVEEPRVEDGKYYFVTRGIKPGAINDPEISEDQLLGKVLFTVPLIGSLYDFFSKWYGFAAFIAILLIAFSTELFNLFSILRSSKEEPDPDLPAGAKIPEYNPQFNEVITQEAGELLTELDDTQ